MNQLLHLLLISILILYAQALTFTSQKEPPEGEEGKGNNKEDISSDNMMVKTAVRGAKAAISQNAESSNMNTIVESFYSSSSSDDPTDTNSIALKDEIHLMASTDALKSFLVSVRRQLHKHPELMYQGVLL